MPRDVSLNWTTAQKSEIRNLQPGQFLGFHRAVKGVAKNETAEVVRVDGMRKQSFVMKTENCGSHHQQAGQEFRCLRKARHRGDCRRQVTACCQSARATWLPCDRRRNRHRQDEWTRTGGSILRMAVSLPSNFRQFAHGYAVTAHRSQGKSVDAVIVLADGCRRSCSTSQRRAVKSARSLSRATSSCSVTRSAVQPRDNPQRSLHRS